MKTVTSASMTENLCFLIGVASTAGLIPLSFLQVFICLIE